MEQLSRQQVESQISERASALPPEILARLWNSLHAQGEGNLLCSPDERFYLQPEPDMRAEDECQAREQCASELERGDYVRILEDPNDADCPLDFEGSFVARKSESLITVRDQNDNAYDVNISRLDLDNM